MLKRIAFIFLLFVPICLSAQDLPQDLASAINKLQADEQFKNAAIGIYIVDAKNGKPVMEKSADVGMAPASCQKVITSASAFELLSGTYVYKTLVGVDGKIVNGVLQGNLIVRGLGDPTLGSWRWPQTKTDIVNKQIAQILHGRKIEAIAGKIIVDDLQFGYQSVPDGWIWQDIGNYYGAGASGFNWNENQYEAFLQSGAEEGTNTKVIATSPIDIKGSILNFVSVGKKGSGDNAYLYATPYGDQIFATGTIPPSEEKFSISGAMPMPGFYFAKQLHAQLSKAGFDVVGDFATASIMLRHGQHLSGNFEKIGALNSPVIDSINFWFLRKSINLYGEALVKAIAFQKSALNVSTDTGIAIIRRYWQSKGIQPGALNIIDGSGLSPTNRLTTKSLVTVLQYARERQWFSSFFNALPMINNIKMKDGYINGVRSYAGYVKSATGKEYTFAFIVNNFYGNPAKVREKMWRVLDLLKR